MQTTHQEIFKFSRENCCFFEKILCRFSSKNTEATARVADGVINNLMS